MRRCSERGGGARGGMGGRWQPMRGCMSAAGAAVPGASPVAGARGLLVAARGTSSAYRWYAVEPGWRGARSQSSVETMAVKFCAGFCAVWASRNPSRNRLRRRRRRRAGPRREGSRRPSRRTALRPLKAAGSLRPRPARPPGSLTTQPPLRIELRFPNFFCKCFRSGWPLGSRCDRYSIAATIRGSWRGCCSNTFKDDRWIRKNHFH